MFCYWAGIIDNKINAFGVRYCLINTFRRGPHLRVASIPVGMSSTCWLCDRDALFCRCQLFVCLFFNTASVLQFS